jgi:hypothetical protein
MRPTQTDAATQRPRGKIARLDAAQEEWTAAEEAVLRDAPGAGRRLQRAAARLAEARAAVFAGNGAGNGNGNEDLSPARARRLANLEN